MTEAQWLTSTNPDPMLVFLYGKASERKLRLFGHACVRRFWHLLQNEELQAAIETSERHADGLIDRAHFGKVISDANRARLRINLHRTAYDAARYNPASFDARSIARNMARVAASVAVPDVPPSHISRFEGGRMVCVEVPMSPAREKFEVVRASEFAAQAQLLRDIFGNPLLSVELQSHWLTTNVIALAKHIYEQRVFDRMPELAQALQLAGCTEQLIVEHCATPAPHARGCWVLDRLLGME